MKRMLFIVLSCLMYSVLADAQTNSPTGPSTSTSTSASKTTKRAVFRPNKEQIKFAQAKLKAARLYSGDATGRLDPASRTAIKSFQKDNGLKQTGTLNRATLEKLGVELTEKQKLIPVSPSFANTDTKTREARSAKTPRRIFRATKQQVIEAQKVLKAGGWYTGEESGKLDTATRAGLKKYQEKNGLKVTGTLNQVTLEKMSITLTDSQKSASTSTPSTPSN